MSDQPDPKGYGNIYTPHAGSMIIAVQREGGLASRTIVLSEGKVKLLRLLLSKTGIVVAVVALASWIFFGVEAARVPMLTAQLQRMEHDAARLDTLEFTLAQLQKRYEQVQHMLGVSTPPAAASPTRGSSSRPIDGPPPKPRVAAPVKDSTAPMQVLKPVKDTTPGSKPRADSAKPAADTLKPPAKGPDTSGVHPTKR